MRHIIFVFSSAATAGCRVAGIPAAARVVHAIASLPSHKRVDSCTIAVDPTWTPSPSLLAECRRLAPGLRIAFRPDTSRADVLAVRGEPFLAAIARHGEDGGCAALMLALSEALTEHGPLPGRSEADGLRYLRRAERDILASTGKGEDGIVSRYINRPISRLISRQLLRLPGLAPWHASVGTAILGLTMALFLFLGSDLGLVAGALLFQVASIFDGVDGEMARATFNTSDGGATLDSVIDATTNLAFITGVTVNVALSGDLSGAAAGGVALLTLASGLCLIGRRAHLNGEPMNFDVLKRHFRKGGPRSAIMEALIHLTMRDFFAAACAVMIIAGFTHLLLLAFATIAFGWLTVTGIVLAGTSSVRCSPVTNEPPNTSGRSGREQAWQDARQKDELSCNRK